MNQLDNKNKQSIKYIYDNYNYYMKQLIKVNGWIRSVRKQKEMYFVEINDGSCLKSIQIVFNTSNINPDKYSKLKTGISVSVLVLVTESPIDKQPFELVLENDNNLEILGSIDDDVYPIAKSKLSLEYLRTCQHFRIRTNTFGAISRIRHQLAMATHNFLGLNKNFILVAPPQITCNDCEGGGEAFQVTTILKDGDKDRLKFDKNGKIDYSKDFFKSPAYLTVSGQLALETYCLALGGVYSYQSAFRADPSQTSRHVAEFTMLEVEIPFADLSDNMDLAEEYFKYTINHCLNQCKDDVDFLDKMYYQKRTDNQKFMPTLNEYLNKLVSESFCRMSYTEVMKILLEKQELGHIFETPIPESGIFDFKSEHERYLTDQILKKPVFVTHYPKKIKAFYMKQSDNKSELGFDTVECCDLLVPGIGEVLGGSCRTADYDTLKSAMIEHGLSDSSLDYYLDLRKYGSVEHCGFGIGMSRLMMLITSMENIKDTIEYPRSMGSISY